MFGKSKNNRNEERSTPSFLANAEDLRGPSDSLRAQVESMRAQVETARPAPAPAPVAEPEPAKNGNGAPGAFLLDRNKPSVISEGFSLMGDINATGVLHVEGFIKGTISTDVVNIGPSGAVEGTLQCRALHIKGTFVGTAICDELYIAGKAKVSGRVTYHSLSAQRGALVEGEVIHANME